MRLRDKRVLVPWSGGLDSTYLVWKLLKDGATVIPFYVDIRNNQSKSERELRAISQGAMDEPHNGREIRWAQRHVHLDASVPDFLQDRRYRQIKMSGWMKNGDVSISRSAMEKTHFAETPKWERKFERAIQLA